MAGRTLLTIYLTPTTSDPRLPAPILVGNLYLVHSGLDQPSRLRGFSAPGEIPIALLRPPPVVHVPDGKPPARLRRCLGRAVEQRHRVGPARNGEQHGAARRNQARLGGADERDTDGIHGRMVDRICTSDLGHISDRPPDRRGPPAGQPRACFQAGIA